MRLATWNVNSARARHFRLVDWLDRAAPDVACLQETKMGDEEFDALYSDDLFRRGYAVAHFGQGRWNGVAVLSRVGLDDVVKGLPGGRRSAGGRGARARRHLRRRPGVVAVRAERPHAGRPDVRRRS